MDVDEPMKYIHNIAIKLWNKKYNFLFAENRPGDQLINTYQSHISYYTKALKKKPSKLDFD